MTAVTLKNHCSLFSKPLQSFVREMHRSRCWVACAKYQPRLRKIVLIKTKRELSDYLSGGGTARDYMLLCDERLEIELGKLAIYKKDLETLSESAPSNLESLWESRNAELRDMDLPTLLLPD